MTVLLLRRKPFTAYADRVAEVNFQTFSTNVDALDRSLSELDDAGRLKSVDVARVQMTRSMARALDEDPSNAALWRQYREAFKELVTDDADPADSADDLLA